MQSQWQSYSNYYNILDNCFNHNLRLKKRKVKAKKGNDNEK